MSVGIPVRLGAIPWVSLPLLRPIQTPPSHPQATGREEAGGRHQSAETPSQEPASEPHKDAFGQQSRWKARTDIAWWPHEAPPVHSLRIYRRSLTVLPQAAPFPETPHENAWSGCRGSRAPRGCPG